jgi:hypothetical protein
MRLARSTAITGTERLRKDSMAAALDLSVALEVTEAETAAYSGAIPREGGG